MYISEHLEVYMKTLFFGFTEKQVHIAVGHFGLNFMDVVSLGNWHFFTVKNTIMNILAVC